MINSWEIKNAYATEPEKTTAMIAAVTEPVVSIQARPNETLTSILGAF